MADNKKNQKQVPDRFLCPITHEVMADPVHDGEGHFFERKAIADWLAKHDTCPLTRKPLAMSKLKDATELRKEIQKFSGKPGHNATPVSGATTNHRMTVKSNYTLASDTPFPYQKGEAGDEDYFLHLQLESSESTRRSPVDVCCVVDVSGSMQIEATVQDNEGKELESNGLSILDVVKHAVRTIIHALQPGDRLSLVSFSNNATLVLGLTQMSAAGKKRAEQALEKMTPDGATNLWDGLYTGMETLRKGASKGRFSACLLLTDGQPNVEPPLGHLPALRKYKTKNDYSCSINTFGFGYSIDSELLTSLSSEGGGNYVFTPDGGFVGTAFVNALSNLLSTFAHSIEVVIDPKEGVTVGAKGQDTVLGGYPIRSIASGGAVVTVGGSAHFGQSRDIVVPIRIKKGASTTIFDSVSVVARYTLFNGDAGKSAREGGVVHDDLSVQAQLARLYAADKLRECSVMARVSFSNGSNALKECISLILKSSSSSQTPVKALLNDLTIQATQALSKEEWFRRWGQHYLPSLSMSHSAQICTNFKDPGLQLYGGKLFKTIQDELDTIFLSLPPPQPAKYVSPYAHMAGPGYQAAPVQSRSVDMRDYYNCRGGCFASDCLVRMGDGSLKKVSQVRRGDVLSTGEDGGKASVVCVVKTVFLHSPPVLVSLPGGLQITEYHPVRIDGKWHFPNTLASASPSPTTDFVCSFVLDRGHVCVVNGVECVGLGHDFTDDSVVAHPFFGSQKIVEALTAMEGWKDGMVVLQANAFLKSRLSDLIESLDTTKEIKVGGESRTEVSVN